MWLYEFLNAYEHGDFYLGQEHCAATIDYFSIQNEPELQGDIWGWSMYCNTSEYAERFDEFISYFDKKKDVTKPQIVFPDTLESCQTVGNFMPFK